ncbi:MAG: 16S rRNA (guanine(966)-N(2))-methyltransferase RsmD, partial [Thermoanaerobaculia bacterium]|nr:16S rRNA (guanine(966)-N(2))-methyltransferase RsmD [Thermoanaerobaculia bacterium]
PGSRPSTERLREALFSIWQSEVAGSRFLDLFCGSGVVGLEALSRGAESVVLADASRRSLATARDNVRRLELGAAVTIVAGRLPGLVGRLVAAGPFDLVFADPPYGFEGLAKLLAALPPLLTGHGRAAVEHAADESPEIPTELELVDRRVYGQSALTLLRLQGSVRSRNEVSSR